jgi:N-acetylglucosamine malate deacetylase 1
MCAIFIDIVLVYSMAFIKTDYFYTLKSYLGKNSHPWPKSIKIIPGKHLLVIAPHFDDEAIGCGGAILAHKALGNKVTVVYLTDGCHGDKNRLYGDIRSIRSEEAKKACKILGISDYRLLNQPDSKLKPTPKLCSLLAEIIGEVKPESILIPWFLDDDGDHKAANVALARVAARSRLDFNVYSYEVWSLLHPNITVDISAFIGYKRKALKAYSSQLNYHNFLNSVLGLNRYRSVYNLCGNGYAEAFFRSSKNEYIRLSNLLGVGK